MTQTYVKPRPAPVAPQSALRRLLLSAGISATGDGFSIVAFGLLAVRATDDPRLIACVFIAQRCPWLAGLWVARAIDRLRRPALALVAADAARATVLIVTIVAIAAVGPSIAALAACGFLLGIGTLVHAAARNALLPLVAEGRDLSKANGYLSSAEGIGYAALGPAAGGLVFAFGQTVPFGLDAASFLVSAVRTWPLVAVTAPERTRPEAAGPAGIVRTVVRHPLLSLLLAQMAILGFTQALVLAVMPLYLTRQLGLSGGWYGVFLGVAAVGGVLTGLTTPQLWQRRQHTSNLVLGAGLVAGFCYIGMSDLRSAVAAAALLFVFDGTVGVMNTVSPTLRLEHAPTAGRAQTSTLFRQAILAAQPVGAVLSGVLARRYGVTACFTLAGSLIVVVFALSAPRFRRTVLEFGA